MREPSPTALRIIEAGRKLFNANGYGETSLSQIAASVGISQGNLTYHFPTKRQLAHHIQHEAKARAAAHQHDRTPQSVASDYVDHLISGMDLTWRYRFLFRDRAQFISDQKDDDPNAALIADFAALRALIQRLEDEGHFLSDPARDLAELTRSLWIVSRYWMNFLSEIEELVEITWRDQERGVQQHLALLRPALTPEACDAFDAAIENAKAARGESQSR